MSGQPPKALTGIGVAMGPGSFTGLRIGLSAAKGLALARNLPIAGVPSLEVLVASQPGLRRPMIAMLQVGRGRYAWARFRYKTHAGGQITETQVDDIKTIAKTISSPVYVVGEMGAEERQIMGGASGNRTTGAGFVLCAPSFRSGRACLGQTAARSCR